MKRSKEFTKGEPLLPGDTSRRRGGNKQGARGYKRGDQLPPSFESWSFTERQLKSFEIVLRALIMDGKRQKLQLEAQLEQLDKNIERLEVMPSDRA